MGKNYKEESQIVFTVFQRCSLQSHHTGRYFVFGVTVFYDCYHGTPKAYASPG